MRPATFPPAGARRRLTRRALACLALALGLSLAPAARPQTLRVLHWWRSTSERMASETLAAPVRAAGVDWIDEDAGDGVGAAIILRSRILARDMPDVAQANSMAAHDWARLGLVAELDAVAATGHWDRRLLPAVDKLVRSAGHVLAVPLGIHRLNTLFYNRRVFARLNLAPPATWAEFERIAPLLQRAGLVPLAQSSEPWQVAILFESLVLADGGVALHERLMVRNDDSAFTDPRVALSLQHLRALKRWMARPVPETRWMQVARELGSGRAAMLIGGDWIKGELQTEGLMADQAFGCVTVPGTAGMHVYDVDTLAMLRSAQAPRAAQEKVARIAMDAGLQERYNRVKGSVSVLRGADPAAMDSCARASWTLFATPGATLVPSMAIGMTGDEVMRDALIAEVHRFFMDDNIAVQDTQRRLAAVSRAYTRTRLP